MTLRLNEKGRVLKVEDRDKYIRGELNFNKKGLPLFLFGTFFIVLFHYIFSEFAFSFF